MAKKNTTQRDFNMDTFTATMIAEGEYDLAGYDDDDPPCYETVVEAWQHLIDTGLAWQLQGWFGRQAAHLIQAGLCHHNG